MTSEKEKYTSRKKGKKNKVFNGFIIIPLLLCIMSLVIFMKNNIVDSGANNRLTEKIYNSMLDKNNRIKAYNKAVSLNSGTSANTCVYFLSEVLRMNGLNIDENTSRTDQLVTILKNMGWKMETDFQKLKAGDICFTTDANLAASSAPTHTYIFMSWVKSGSYDYAYVCDNQAKDYENKILHVRNVAKVDAVKGEQKDPFSFFLYK